MTKLRKFLVHITGEGEIFRKEGYWKREGNTVEKVN